MSFAKFSQLILWFSFFPALKDNCISLVQGPGMVTFIHLAKNVNSAELGWYGEPILDVCSRNIASSDELWDLVVEMSVLLLTCIERGNPRSPWYAQILSEMLDHLERQPESKKRRVAWLLHIEPVLNAMGLLLLAHFRRIFVLVFQWLHAEDDETIILVLERVHTIVKLTWVRKSPFILRLIDELTLVYKVAAMKKEREAIRTRIVRIIVLLQKCQGTQLEAAWEKHKDDPDLAALTSLHRSSKGALPR
ncbi:hypothetical protein Taro_042247 [Colocasia esculenta]|uniref:Uncharacterized protein n=1 Tax=Colocasia esculenta TaxID=4460 RepID=A0A843WHX9_COLES|nr:hypothetical protein [Colocasia esculenta]